jgi:hypothetical protein
MQLGQMVGAFVRQCPHFWITQAPPQRRQVSETGRGVRWNSAHRR